jgi:hypothetical protein
LKTLNYKTKPLSFEAPKNLKFRNPFYKFLYSEVYNRIIDSSEYEPVWDVDDIHSDITMCDKIVKLAKNNDENVKQPSPKAENRDRLIIQHYVRHFLEAYPECLGLFKNAISLQNQVIENAEFLYGEKCSVDNFIKLKKIIDEQNKIKWGREKDGSESQSGVSTLGQISEGLLNRIFLNLVDNKNFFKVDRQEVSSYGDFVLMCLPNNLFISVKSNFARERMLASGYNTDIIGAGFFENYKEFTSLVKNRNLQRAGFLAMYCPDVAVNVEQEQNNTSTYDKIVEFYKKKKIEMPKNINGTDFIRRLSNLEADISILLDQDDVRKRVTVKF